MTKVIVDVEKLAKFSNDLITDVNEFDQITKKMEEIINSLASGWQGYDAEIFISNAVYYIENLYTVKKAIVDSASTIQKNAEEYANRINAFLQS